MAQPASMRKAKSVKAGRVFIAEGGDDLGYSVITHRRREFAKIPRKMNNYAIAGALHEVDLGLPFAADRHEVGQVKHLLVPILLLTAIYCQAHHYCQRRQRITLEKTPAFAV